MATDLIIATIVSALLAVGGIWCARRPPTSPFRRWLRLQAWPMFALILISYAAAFDPADRYSAQLGRATGSGLVLYLAASAVVVIVRGEHKRNP